MPWSTPSRTKTRRTGTSLSSSPRTASGNWRSPRNLSAAPTGTLLRSGPSSRGQTVVQKVQLEAVVDEQIELTEYDRITLRSSCRARRSRRRAQALEKVSRCSRTGRPWNATSNCARNSSRTHWKSRPAFGENLKTLAGHSDSYQRHSRSSTRSRPASNSFAARLTSCAGRSREAGGVGGSTCCRWM